MLLLRTAGYQIFPTINQFRRLLHFPDSAHQSHNLKRHISGLRPMLDEYLLLGEPLHASIKLHQRPGCAFSTSEESFALLMIQANINEYKI